MSARHIEDQTGIGLDPTLWECQYQAWHRHVATEDVPFWTVACLRKNLPLVTCHEGSPVLQHLTAQFLELSIETLFIFLEVPREIGYSVVEIVLSTTDYSSNFGLDSRVTELLKSVCVL